MTPVFLDTSGLIALVNADDEWHSRAEKVWQSLIAQRVQLVTTSIILVEIGYGLSRVHLRSLAVQLRNRLTSAPHIQIVPLDADVEQRAWKLFCDRADKEWGMTDCVSFIVMHDIGLNEAFTSDHHFEQAGFIPLLEER